MITDQKQTSEINIQKYKDISWIDVVNPDSATLAKLEKDYHLHPVHLDESVQKIQLTQVEREEQYIFLLLHIPIYNADEDRLLINQVGIFLGKDYLITIHSGESPTITELFKLCESSDKLKQEYYKNGSGYLLYSIIKRLLNDLSGISEGVLKELDAIEDLVFDNNSSDAYRIGQVRQKITRLKRVIASLKIVLGDLAHEINSFTGDSLFRHYSSNAKTANRLWEVIEEAKETIEIYKDADFTTSTEQTNRILAVLTLLFTLTIPMTVVGTLYGTNVPLPGGIQSGAWTFWGPYTTFAILLSSSSALAVLMYFYFKRKKWF